MVGSAYRNPPVPLPAKSAVGKDCVCEPYWGYEDIGIFFVFLVLLTPALRLLVHLHLLLRSELTNPSIGLQFALVAFLSLTLYLVLKLRHQRPVLRPLGWVLPRTVYTVAALVLGIPFASGVALYLRLRNQNTPPIPLFELVALGLVFGPILEESFFRGCLLPLLAQTTGNGAAVIATALLFALFHGPADLAHWASFTATGVAYGWLRVASRSTTAPALMHAIYNLTLFLSAAS
jgi:membrane protease YdiL (CAAX protease family)